MTDKKGSKGLALEPSCLVGAWVGIGLVLLLTRLLFPGRFSQDALYTLTDMLILWLGVTVAIIVAASFYNGE